MFSVKKISIITVGTMAIGLGSVKPVSAASLYEVVGLNFTPTDINNSSQVVGANYLWENGNVTDLTTLPGGNNFSSIEATAINNNGTIVGDGRSSSGTEGFISNGSNISALILDCETFCNNSDNRSVRDINDFETVGIVIAADSDLFGVTVDRNGTGYGVIGAISAVNNRGQIASTVSSGRSGTNGILSEDLGQGDFEGIFLIPAASAFGPLPSQPSDRSRASDLDDNGNVVGASLVIPSLSLENTLKQATLWKDPTQPGVSLGTLGGQESEALGINNLMQVVGSSFLEDDSTQHAFLWEDGNLIDLNSLVDPGIGWELTSAFEINNNGDIIGIGNFNGEQRGFIAKAVPEPTSVLGVLGLGLFGLSNWRKRKK
jgi:probable HAF family extracellular repeat protein